MTLFTSQRAANFYDKLFSSLDFTLPGAATGRRGFPKEAMVCAFIVMKCEGFSQITDLADYLDNNRLIAHYCGFNIMEPLPSYWTYDRCLRQLDNTELKSVMADLVRKLYELGIVDASFIGLDSTPVMANTKQNNPKSFAKSKFSKKNHPKSDPDCALGVHSASNQHNERNRQSKQRLDRHGTIVAGSCETLPMSGGMSSTGGTRAMCWWTASPACRSTS